VPFQKYSSPFFVAILIPGTLAVLATTCVILPNVADAVPGIRSRDLIEQRRSGLLRFDPGMRWLTADGAEWNAPGKLKPAVPLRLKSASENGDSHNQNTTAVSAAHGGPHRCQPRWGRPRTGSAPTRWSAEFVLEDLQGGVDLADEDAKFMKYLAENGWEGEVGEDDDKNLIVNARHEEEGKVNYSEDVKDY